jgi:CubicO group peptidase (beta-lactamase class C family)
MGLIRIVAAVVLVLLVSGAAGANGLPTARPDEVGLSAERLQRIGRTLRTDVERGRLPGAVIAVARRGRLAYLEAIGVRDKATNAPMTTDAIFRLASMTKPFASVAAMMLYEDGRLFLSDPVSKHLPALGQPQVGAEQIDPATGRATFYLVPAQREMTVQDLLRHTSGLTYGNRGTTQIHKAYPEGSGVASRTLTGAELVARLSKAPLLHQPGTAWEYGFSTDVLGLVVEAVAGKTLSAFLDERLFKPLAMSDTAFVVPAAKAGRIAQPLAKDPDTGRDITMPDFTAPAKFECGGACAVSTTGDYVRFAQMLLNRGSLDGARILGRKTVEYMTSDHLGTAIASSRVPNAYGFGLGFAVRRATGGPDLTGSAGDYNWGGAYGTYFWIDPKEELVVVYMAQAPNAIRVHYRDLVKSLVLQAIVD